MINIKNYILNYLYFIMFAEMFKAGKINDILICIIVNDDEIDH